VKAGDVGFNSSGCGPWFQEPGPFASRFANPGDPFGAGDFAVNHEVAPGNYWAEGATTGGCYWARLSSFDSELPSIIANSFTTGGAQMVTISPSDVGFTSDGCGIWFKI
jgi:hypothetical protein